MVYQYVTPATCDLHTKSDWCPHGINTRFERDLSAVLCHGPRLVNLITDKTLSSATNTEVEVRQTGPRPVSLHKQYIAVPPICFYMNQIDRPTDLQIFEFDEYRRDLQELLIVVRSCVTVAEGRMESRDKKVSLDEALEELATMRDGNYYDKYIHKSTVVRKNGLYKDCARAVTHKSQHYTLKPCNVFWSIVRQLVDLCPTLLGINGATTIGRIRLLPDKTALDLVAKAFPRSGDEHQPNASSSQTISKPPPKYSDLVAGYVTLRDLATCGLSTQLKAHGTVRMARDLNIPFGSNFYAFTVSYY